MGKVVKGKGQQRRGEKSKLDSGIYRVNLEFPYCRDESSRVTDLVFLSRVKALFLFSLRSWFLSLCCPSSTRHDCLSNTASQSVRDIDKEKNKRQSTTEHAAAGSVRAILKLPFEYLNDSFSLPLSILQLVKSLPFYIPTA